MTRSPVRFQIVGTDGRPVTEGYLSVVRSSVPFPEIALLSDAKGFVEVKLPVGHFTLRAQSVDGRRGDITISTPRTTAVVEKIVVR